VLLCHAATLITGHLQNLIWSGNILGIRIFINKMEQSYG
jgi:hypothetical protein